MENYTTQELIEALRFLLLGNRENDWVRETARAIAKELLSEDRPANAREVQQIDFLMDFARGFGWDL